MKVLNNTLYVTAWSRKRKWQLWALHIYMCMSDWGWQSLPQPQGGSLLVRAAEVVMQEFSWGYQCSIKELFISVCKLFVSIVQAINELIIYMYLIIKNSHIFYVLLYEHSYWLQHGYTVYQRCSITCMCPVTALIYSLSVRWNILRIMYSCSVAAEN